MNPDVDHPQHSTVHASALRRRAFTLVELLVVIGIIALLITIMLPSLMGARRTARRVACESNLRQWGLAVRMYADMNDGYLPRRGQGVNATQQIDRPSDWFNALPPVMGLPTYSVLAATGQIARPATHSVYSCPEAFDDGGANFWSYGMNMWLSVWNSGTPDLPDKFNGVGPQVSMMFLADGPAQHCSVSPAPSPAYEYSPLARHGGMVNIAFLDGHVDSLSAAYVGCGIGFIEHSDLRWRVPGSTWDSAQH